MTEPRDPPPLKEWALGLCLITAGSLIPSILLITTGSAGLTVLAVIGALVLAGLLFGEDLTAASAVGMIPALFFVSFAAKPLYHLALAEVAREVSVREAPDRSQAETFVFRDGRIELSMARVKVGRRGKHGRTRHWVAPILPPGWSPKERVPAWAVYTQVTRREGPPKRWSNDARVAFRAFPEEEYDGLIATTEKVHGLRTAAGAPRVEVASQRFWERYIWIGVSVFVLGCLVWSIPWLMPRGRAPAPPSRDERT